MKEENDTISWILIGMVIVSFMISGLLLSK